MNLKRIQVLSHQLSGNEIDRIGDLARKVLMSSVIKGPVIEGTTKVNTKIEKFYVLKVPVKRDKRIEMLYRGIYRKQRILFLPTIEVETMNKAKTLKYALKLLKGKLREQVAGLSILKSLVKLEYKEAKPYLKIYQGLDWIENYEIMDRRYQKHLSEMRKEKADKELLIKQAEELIGWKEGRGELSKSLQNSKFAYLKIVGKEIITSKRAIIKVQEVLRVYDIWLKKADKILGQKIGSFPIVRANGEWKIGCHSIQPMEILDLLCRLKLPVYAELTHSNN